jgi:hypothetical protein
VLLSEECRIARQESLHGQTGGTTAEEVARALHSINIPVEQVQDIVAVLTSRRGSTGTARDASGPPADSTSRLSREEEYAASALTATCWNCGVTGHRLINCPQPIVKPLKFRPANYIPSFGRSLLQGPG